MAEVYKVYGYYGKNGRKGFAYTEGEVFEIEGVRYGVSDFEPIGNNQVRRIPYYRVTELSTGMAVAKGPTQLAARSNTRAIHNRVKKVLGFT